MDWTQVIDLMREINIAQLAVMATMMWSMYSRLDAKIEKVNAKIDGVDRRLSDKIDGIDRRLCRIEGALSAGSHCALRNSDERKAE